MRALPALTALLLWLMPALALGQPQPALLVVVRDADGRGVAGITVTVRDVEGQQVFTGLTDAQGQVAVEQVPSPELRVAVSGTVAGVPLRQLGDDAQGVLVFQTAPPLVVELRVDQGGVVIPDLSMLALEPVDMPTAQVGAAVVATSQPLATSVAPPAVPRGDLAPGSSQEASEGSGVLIGVIAITIVLAAIVAVLAHERRVA